jgi:glycosyltransferase involved in cell wall biosynthesis
MKNIVSIAIATYNGEKFLKEQLDSIYGQTYKEIEVIVCDDCSTDGTVEILDNYSKIYGLKYIINSSQLGSVKTFERAVSFCKTNYYALSDQDDVWLPNKIETLIQQMLITEQTYPNQPIIVHHDVFIVDKDLKNINKKFLYNDGKTSGFKNMLFSNAKIQGAATLFNKQLKDLSFPFPDNIPLHDLYLSYICETFGKRIYITQPLMLYRQHDNNQIGAEIISRGKRIRNFFQTKVILANDNEKSTVRQFYYQFNNVLKIKDKNIINNYFSILDFNTSLVLKLYKVIKFQFNSSGSVLKLIIKIIRSSIY